MYDPNDISSEQIDELLALGQLDEQTAQQMRQMKMADMLRGSALEGTPTKMYGNVAVAPTVFNGIANYMKYRKGEGMADKAETKLAGIGQQRTAGRRSYFDLLLGKGKKDQGPMVADQY